MCPLSVLFPIDLAPFLPQVAAAWSAVPSVRCLGPFGPAAFGKFPKQFGAFSMGKSWENDGKMEVSWEYPWNYKIDKSRESSSMSNSKSMFCSKNMQIKNIVDIDVW